MAEYVRGKGIGGSDVGKILGISRFGNALDAYSQILQIETYQKPNETPDARRGKALEIHAVREYAIATGRGLVECIRIQHPERPHFYASVDRLIISEKGKIFQPLEKGILEVKCPRSSVYKDIMDEGIYPEMYAQLQHYLGVLNLRWGAFCIFNADWWEINEFDVERDDKYIDEMWAKLDEFWMNHIIPKIPPTIGTAAMTTKTPRLGTESVAQNTPEWVDAMQQLKKAVGEFKLAEHHKTLAQERIKTMMGDLTRISVPGIGKVAWYESSNSTIDRERLRMDHPELDLALYTNIAATRPFLATFK